MSRKRARDILVVILFIGAFFRIQKLNWDEYHHLHPDERFISMVEEKLQAPSSLRQYFDSSSPPLNPYNRGNDSFVYGTVPMFVSKAVGGLIGKKGYDGTFLAGRALSAAPDELKPYPLAALGWVHYKRQEFERAIDCLRKSSERAATPTTFHHLGMAYLATGRLEEAKTAFHKAKTAGRGGKLEDRVVQQVRSNLRLLEKAGSKKKPARSTRLPPQASHGTYTSGRKCISIWMIPSPLQFSQRPPLTLKLKRPGL